MITATRTRALVGTLRLTGAFSLERGGAIDDVRIGYEVNGASDAPLVIALGGISAGRHVASHAGAPAPGWWDAVVGPGRGIDTRRARVLAIDWLAGVGASSGPAAFSKPDGTRHAVTTHDQARAVIALLDELGVARAHAVVGASYGGMVALALASLAPSRVARTIAIAAAERSHPMATALRTLQRRVVRLGLATGRATESLAIARGIAMTTYRTAAEFAGRFATRPLSGVEPARFDVESYLEQRGERFAQAFSPDAFLALSESLDLHDVDPAMIAVPTTLIGFDSDTLVPPAQLHALHARLPAPAGFIRIPTLFGHDAFLKESDAMARTLTPLLQLRGAS